MRKKQGPRRYAEGTTVSADRSQAEIKQLLTKHGAMSFGLLETQAMASMVCEFRGRRLKFDVPRTKDTQEYMRQWRVLLLRIKARLEEVSGGDATVDESFMPYILLPNGHTVGESIVPAIENAYVSGTVPALLLTYQQ